MLTCAQQAAKALAAANGNADIIQALRDYFLTEKPLAALPLHEKVDKIKLEFERCDLNKNKIIDIVRLNNADVPLWWL